MLNLTGLPNVTGLTTTLPQTLPQTLPNPQSSAQTAASWQQLSPLFTRIETTRVALQLELLLLDSIFAEVISTCDNAADSVCRIPAGELEAEYTPALEARLAALLATDLATPSDNTSVQLELLAVRDLIEPGDTLAFSALSYQAVTSQPYAYRLQLDALQLLPDTPLVLDWSADFTHVAYQLQPLDSINNDRYLYQDLASAQQLTVRDSSLPFLDGNGEIVVEITAGKSNLDEVLFSAKYALSTVTGRASDTRAFTSTTDYALDQQLFLQESFGNAGEVLEFLSCAFTDFDEDCLDEDLLDSELFISEEDFERTLEEYGFDDVRILNLPTDVRDFEILEVLDGVPLDERDVLCEGWQAPFDNDLELFCFAEPERVATGIVVYYDDADNIIVVDQAEILISAVEGSDEHQGAGQLKP